MIAAGVLGQCDGGENTSANEGGEDSGTPLITTEDAGSVVTPPVTPPASGCEVAALSCPAGATGYVCNPADDPGDMAPTSVCSAPTVNGEAYEFCCSPWPSGNGCVRDHGFPCDSNAYPLQCQPGSVPSTIEPGLQCGSPFIQSNGDNEYCCTGL